MSCLKATGTVFIYIGLFLAIITFIPGLPPDIEFSEISVVPPRDLDPRFPKNRLTGCEKLFEGQLTGAEGFSSYNGQLYSGIHGGYIIRLEEDRFVPIVKFGKKCDGIWQEHICGRPLGMKFDKKGNLFVVDTYYGIFKVNVETGEYTNIVNSSKPINGKVPMLPNSVDVAENGDLYWTDSSTALPLNILVPLFFVNPSGRFIRYNAATKKNEVLMENLAFANGVKLSDDESFVLVAESLLTRIMKYHLKGPKAGQKEIFIDALPGMPDNLQSDGRGGFFVTMVITVDSEHPQLSVSLLPHPYLRKMIVRLLLLLRAPFKLLNDLIPNVYCERMAHAMVSYQGIGMLFDQKRRSLLLRLDASGNIIEALSSDDDTFSGISDAYIHNGYVWFGSPWRSYIPRVPLKQAFPDLANDEKLSSGAKSEKRSASSNSERTKRDTDSVTTKPTESKPKAAPTTPKPTAAPTTTPKPTAVPSQAPKASKPTTDSGSAKSSETKPASKPNAKTETKTNTAKSGKNAKVEQDAPVKQKMPNSQSAKVKSAEANRPKEEF
ncbi:adipocyte plasma membrane-associated protein [Ooceraea biroi]|nr:adipocyte plasma membrane-associated protein [Ooceraea biroi]EZA51944.1 Adipocyte plasma membrane-associated protein [Ooceraea biroi]